ncbi:MAG: PAS domain S-box protein [Salinibacter sp.]
MPDEEPSPTPSPGVFFAVERTPDVLEGPIVSPEYRRRLRAIVSGEQSSSEKLQALLELGTTRLGVEHGHLAQIDPTAATHTITEVSAPHSNVRRGATTELSSTYCRKVLVDGDALAVTNAPAQNWASDPAYQAFGFATYFGAMVQVDGGLYGTVCFVDREPRTDPFSESDATEVSLLVYAIEQVLGQKRPATQSEGPSGLPEALLTEAPDLMYVHDRAGTLLFTNARLQTELGYDADELRALKVWDLDPDMQAEEAMSRWENLRPSDRSERESRYAQADGSTFPVEVHRRCLDRREGRRYVVSARDRTERKEQERRYEAIFNQTYQFIGLMEPDGTLIEANDTALQFGGLDREDVIGKPFWEAYWWQADDETQRELRAAIDRAAAGEFVRYDVEVQGSEQNVVIDFSIRPVTNEKGEVTLLIPEGRNITELKSLKQRERRLEQARNLLAQAQRLADVGGWKVDLRGEPPYVPEWTEQTHKLFEIPRDETLTLEEVLELFPSELRAEREVAIDRALASGEGWDQEFQMEADDGMVRWFHSIAEPVLEDGEVVELRGAFQDITERKRRERQLERQNEQLDQFAGLVSHDLQNPLHVAKGRLDLARHEVDSSHLAAVDKALDRMNAIIEDLLTLTWGEQTLSSEDLSVQRLSDMAEAGWDQVDTAGAVLQLEGEVRLQAEGRRLQRLLENLFRNAVEHGGNGTTVRVGPLDSGFYVADDGPGIPADKRENVLEAGHSSNEEGTGLGLSIVASIAERHGWSMLLTEGQDGGVRVEFTGVL